MQNIQSRNPIPHAARIVAAGFALTVLGAVAANAQDEKYNSISTPAQRAACRPDVFRLCAGEIPSVPKITACLRRKKASLSDGCRVAMGE